jgi:hypothetical protein
MQSSRPLRPKVYPKLSDAPAAELDQNTILRTIILRILRTNPSRISGALPCSGDGVRPIGSRVGGW